MHGTLNGIKSLKYGFSNSLWAVLEEIKYFTNFNVLSLISKLLVEIFWLSYIWNHDPKILLWALERWALMFEVSPSFALNGFTLQNKHWNSIGNFLSSIVVLDWVKLR